MTPHLEDQILPISGMTCPSCAAHVERALKQVSGVARAAVNFATAHANVRFNNRVADTTALVEAVRDAGYDVPTDSATLPIGGMTCVSCAAHVEGGLTDVPGVVSASVNLANERASVSFIPGVATVKDLKRAVEAAGYQVVESEAAETHEEVDQDAGKMAAAQAESATRLFAESARVEQPNLRDGTQPRSDVVVSMMAAQAGWVILLILVGLVAWIGYAVILTW